MNSIPDLVIPMTFTNFQLLTFILSGASASEMVFGTDTIPWLIKPFRVRNVITRFMCSESQILAKPRQIR